MPAKSGKPAPHHKSDPDAHGFISPALARRYLELRPRLTLLGQQVHGRVKAAPSAPAGPVALALCADILTQTYRLVSREPCARALPQRLPEPSPTNSELFALICEADLALQAFEAAHFDADEGLWRVFE